MLQYITRLYAYLFSLFDGTRETIQNKSSAALSGVNIVLNQIDHNLIRDEFTYDNTKSALVSGCTSRDHRALVGIKILVL